MQTFVQVTDDLAEVIGFGTELGEFPVNDEEVSRLWLRAGRAWNQDTELDY
jgi:hypothetical protein